MFVSKYVGSGHESKESIVTRVSAFERIWIGKLIAPVSPVTFIIASLFVYLIFICCWVGVN
jgi:hypothetical protein